MLTAYLGDFKIHTLQYAEYYGDGDNKSFSREENVYQASGITVKKKKDCIGHVQKRVGTTLCKLKRENPGLGGTGKLTDRTSDTLQHYYGTISKCGQFDGNEKAIHAHASLMHCASNKSHYTTTAPLAVQVGASTTRIRPGGGGKLLPIHSLK